MSRPRVSLNPEYSLIYPVITLLNSTVGVAVLAMPYCFQQCGVFLSVLFILFSAICCGASCDVLIKLCLTHRICSIEKACFRHLGLLGKLVTELSIIGLMLGFIIGYNVSIADLGLGILNQVSHFTQQSPNLRFHILTCVTLLILPLCLTPRVQSLSKFSALAVFVYAVLLLHMVILGLPKFLFSLPLARMNWWRPVGLVQCAPIFFASMFCQTQLHTIYTGLSEPSVSAMRQIVYTVIAAIGVAYSLFGFFGYAAFVDSGELTGNIFLMYPKDVCSFLVKTGFLFTITVSIPLILFPLRQSLNSFLCQQVPTVTPELETGIDGSLPMNRFRLMTVLLIATCFLLSLTTDRIEVIIELTFSLAGSLVGYILPALATVYAFPYHNRSDYSSYPQRRISFALLGVGLLLLGSGLLSVRTPPLTETSSMSDHAKQPIRAALDSIDTAKLTAEHPVVQPQAVFANDHLLQAPPEPPVIRDVPAADGVERGERLSRQVVRSNKEASAAAAAAVQNEDSAHAVLTQAPLGNATGNLVQLQADHIISEVPSKAQVDDQHTQTSFSNETLRAAASNSTNPPNGTTRLTADGISQKLSTEQSSVSIETTKRVTSTQPRVNLTNLDPSRRSDDDPSLIISPSLSFQSTGPSVGHKPSSRTASDRFHNDTVTVASSTTSPKPTQSSKVGAHETAAESTTDRMSPGHVASHIGTAKVGQTNNTEVLPPLNNTQPATEHVKTFSVQNNSSTNGSPEPTSTTATPSDPVHPNVMIMPVEPKELVPELDKNAANPPPPSGKHQSPVQQIHVEAR